MEARFSSHVLDRALFAAGDRVMVAVSGGLDSVVALHLVRTCFPTCRIAVAHLDHGARPESAEDARRVAELATSLGLDFITERAKLASHSESVWRHARYDFLGRAADDWGADVIVTAHHADDQVETVLFRMARGAGTRGLAGIPERRGRLVRPLLPFHREQLHAYARARELAWREDESNSDMRHARNRIRHRVLPAMDAASPGARASILTIAALAREAETHWHAELRTLLHEAIIARSENGFTLATAVLRGYHPRILARALRYLCRHLGSTPGRSGTDACAKFISTGRSGGWVRASPGLRLERSFDTMLLRRDVRDEAAVASTDGSTARTCSVTIPQAGMGFADLHVDGRPVRVTWSVEPHDEGDGVIAFDPAALHFPLEVRACRPGDHIRLSYGSKKLKKLFAERRVERSRRWQVPVLAEQESGAVLWLAGIARADVATPTIGAPTFRIRIEE